MVGQGDNGKGIVAKRTKRVVEGRFVRHEEAVQAELPSYQARQLQRQLGVQSNTPLPVCVEDAPVVQPGLPCREH